MAKRLTRADRARHQHEVAARAKTASADVAGGGSARVPTHSIASADGSRSGRSRVARVGIGSELAERVAWSMLAALAALVGAGLALAIGAAIVPALCPSDDGTCTFGWMVLIGMAGYLVALLPACAIGGLGIWFWVAYVAGYSPLLLMAAVGDWWWWTALVLLPPVAAVASAPLGHDKLPAQQRYGLLGIAVMGLAAVVWWYAFAAV